MAQTALITGATGGIGWAIAEALLAKGMLVIGAGRRQDRLDELARQGGERFHGLMLDVVDPRAPDRLIERLPERLQQISVLINNAGHEVGGYRRFDEGSAQDWDDIIATNLGGLMRITRAVVPGMIERGRGSIVNIGSTSGLTAKPDSAAYIASKFAVHGFSQALRADYARTPIRVIEILPGLTRTEFALRRWRGDDARAAGFYDSFPACLSPQDVARSVVFALDQPRDVTIAQLVVMPQGQW